MIVIRKSLHDKGYRQGVLVRGLNNVIEKIQCDASHFTIYNDANNTYCYVYGARGGCGGPRIYQYDGGNIRFAPIIKGLNINTKVL